MVQVNAEIPDSKIDEAIQNEFKSLRKELKSLQGKNSRLETKNSKLQYEINENKDIVKRAQSIIDAVKEAGELQEWEPWGGH